MQNNVSFRLRAIKTPCKFKKNLIIPLPLNKPPSNKSPCQISKLRISPRGLSRGFTVLKIPFAAILSHLWLGAIFYNYPNKLLNTRCVPNHPQLLIEANIISYRSLSKRQIMHPDRTLQNIRWHLYVPGFQMNRESLLLKHIWHTNFN